METLIEVSVLLYGMAMRARMHAVALDGRQAGGALATGAGDAQAEVDRASDGQRRRHDQTRIGDKQ
jgi:hypothetical protein